MNTALIRSLLISAVTLPVVSLAAPVSLSVPDGEYALVAAWRFQGIQTPFIGQAAPWQYYKYTPTSFDIYVDVLGAWSPGNPISFPGEGGIVQPNGGSDTFLFQQHGTPTLPLNLQPGLNLVCCQSDLIASYEDIVGAPPANGTLLYQFNPGPGRNPFHLGAPDYKIFTFMFGTWTPSVPVISVTEAVFILHPQQLNNFQISANGEVTFEVTTPLSRQVTVEYSDSLTQPSWQTLTNFVGTGALVQIKDQPSGNKRFYRSWISQ